MFGFRISIRQEHAEPESHDWPAQVKQSGVDQVLGWEEGLRASAMIGLMSLLLVA